MNLRPSGYEPDGHSRLPHLAEITFIFLFKSVSSYLNIRTKSKNMICGIDEAGRGPIIGPMVIAGSVANEDVIEKLRDLGVKDSKLLSKKKREE